MFGEIPFLEESKESKETDTYSFYYGWIMTAVYMFIANILLLNLVIAMLK